MMHALGVVAEVGLVILGVIVFAGSALALLLLRESKRWDD